MSKKLALLLLVAVPWACAPAAPARSPSGGPPVRADNLTGVWVPGEGSEPPPGPANSCTATRLWRLSQAAEDVHGEMDYCIGPCGIATEVSRGRVADDVLTLAGEFRDRPDAAPQPVRYELRFDPSTQHLIGTRNGRSFWAAPHAPDLDARDCAQRPM